MKLGIVGLPNVGKSTLFNAITNQGAESANYPFCTIDPNVGVVEVPDYRLNVLLEIYNSKKIIPAVVEFVDIAGLVKGASKGEGLGNKFLSNIREVDAIVHVVRCFEDDEIIHVDGNVSPIRDIETINLELVFSDIEIINRRINKNEKAAKTNKAILKENEFLKRLVLFLEEGNNARNFEVDEEDKEFLESLNLLSNKPIIYVCNMKEDDFINNIEKNEFFNMVKEYAKKENAKILPICAKIEQEISDLDEQDKKMFLNDLGLEESGLDRLIINSYELLGLISFITAGEKEIHAWTIKKDTKAPVAAGKIHSDIERGFIRAEVVSFDDINELKSISAVREKGLLRSEGKEYTVKDGDVIVFRFNV